MLIARQEMEHLGLVCNLLTAIGEAPWLTRPNLPLSPRHYDLEVESKLERLTEETLLRFALFEIPAELTPAEQAALGEGIDAARYQTIGELYDEIAALFEQLGEALFIGPPGAELATTDVIPVPLRGISLPNTARIYDVMLVPVTDLATRAWRSWSRSSSRARVRRTARRRATSRASCRCSRSSARSARATPGSIRPARSPPTPTRTPSTTSARAGSACSSTTPTPRCCCS